MFNRQTGAFAPAKPRPLLICWLLGERQEMIDRDGRSPQLALVGSLFKRLVRFFLPLAFAILWALLAPLAVEAADSPARIESVQVGFRGVVEVGRWSPISVQVSGTPGTVITLRVTSADAEGRPVRQSGTPVALGASSTPLSLVYQHGPLECPVVVELLRGDEILEERILRTGGGENGLQTVTQLTDFVVCLGESVLGFERAAQQATEIRVTRPDRVSPLLVQHYSADQWGDLPTDPRGWEAIDVCVISSKCQIPASLGELLKTWVRQGGRLVLLGGEEVTSATSAGLAGWLPVQLEGVVTHRDITELNLSISGSATLRLREGSVRTAHWKVSSGVVLARSLNGPLVVRTGESLGTVTAIALDLNEIPFVRVSGDTPSVVWESLPDLCRWLAGLPLTPALGEGSARSMSDLNPTGVSDLQSQLINSLDRFPEVVRPSYWVVLGAALLFLVIVGPLDYLVVHRLLKRPHWTWVSLPIWIVLGVLVGLSEANRTGGTRELIRQLDVVTWDAHEGAARLDSWLTIYSPRHHRYAVTCTPGPMNVTSKASTQLRWAGQPEAGFRGLYRETEISSGAPLELAPEGQSMVALPIRHGASSVVEAKAYWEQKLPATTDLFDVGDGHLKGTFSHQFEGELVDWVLVYGNFAYLPVKNDFGVESPLRTDETLHAEQIRSRLVTDYLVGLSTRSVEGKDRKTPNFNTSRQAYDPLSRDTLTLLQTVTFHQIAGGTSYTGLSNSTLQTEDLSRLVDAHRAVVFGRWRNAAYDDAETPVLEGVAEPLAAQYSLDGQPVTPRYRECFVRWVLPVKQLADTAARP